MAESKAIAIRFIVVPWVAVHGALGGAAFRLILERGHFTPPLMPRFNWWTPLW
jgi:hypothetical protein